MRAYPQRRSDDDAREQQRAWTEAAPLGHGKPLDGSQWPNDHPASLAASRCRGGQIVCDSVILSC